MNLDTDGKEFKAFQEHLLRCLDMLDDVDIFKLSLHPNIRSKINFKGNDDSVSWSIALTFWDEFPNEFDQLLKATKETLGGENINYKALNDFIGKLNDAGTTNKLKERSQKIKLTWELLQEVCKEVLEQRVAVIKSKYESNTYFQRQEALKVFRQFIDSDKVGFILTGKSGVGKSSFIMSLKDEYSKQSEVCLLIYNAGTLDPKQNLTEIICSDFNKNETWRYRSRNNNDSKDFWVQIRQIEGIQTKKIILVIDAINENSNPKTLFQDIKSLVESEAYLSCLKVVVTCRPESWDSIRGEASLGTNYYKRADKSFSFELEKFKKSELEEVYRKYKEAYNLKSHYSALSLNTDIRDPLLLRLVSEAYRGQSIPDKIDPDETYKKYLDELLNDTDKDFLKKLVVRMIGTKQYLNYILIDDIDNIPLSKAFGTEMTTSQVLQNLCDIGILERSRMASDDKIFFRFERVYEYLISYHLFNKYFLKGKELEYKELIDKVPSSPWLWGVIKQVVVKDLKENGDTIISEFALIESVIAKNILVSSLQEYATTDEEKIKSLLKEHITETKHGWRQGKADSNQLTLVGKINIRRRIAIEAAYHLKFNDILIDGAKDSLSEVRSIAVQYIWYICRKRYDNNFIDNQQENIAFSDNNILILEEIRSRILGGKEEEYFNLNIFGTITNIWDNRNLFESFLRVSLLLWFENYSDTRVIHELKEIWRPIFVKFFLVKQPNSSVPRWILQRLQVVLPWLIQLAFVTLIMIMQKPNKESESWLNTDELSQFFNLKPHYKKIYDKLILYFDTTYGELNDVHKEILELAECRTIITWYFLNTICVRHTAKNPQTTVDLLKKVFDRTSNMSPPPPAIVLVRDAFRWSFSEEQLKHYGKKYTELLRKFTLEILDKHDNFIQLKNKYIYSFIEVYHYLYFRVNKELDETFIQEVMEKLKNKKCEKMYRGFLCDDLPYALGYKSIPSKQVLDILKPFIPLLLLADENEEKKQKQEKSKICHEKIQDKVKELVIESLSMLRIWEPEIVDQFLFDNEVPYSIQNTVKDKNIYNFDNFFSYQLTKFATEALILKYEANSDLKYEANSDFVRQAFGLCSDSSSLRNWLSKVMKLILENLSKNFDS